MTKKIEIPLTKEKEIYNTALIDKQVIDRQIPTISFESKNVRSSLDWDELTVSVSDATAKGALDVFKQVMNELKQEDG
ncbi:MAG: hypothetical protein IMZ52_04765 [Actinobacteria bacterium]|nr:hypothetical protein [Actinomycetota bacterium]MBE3114778.1 hypothetical protein [Actinomycetota bacterium]